MTGQVRRGERFGRAALVALGVAGFAAVAASCSFVGGEQAAPTTTVPPFTTLTATGWTVPTDELAPVPTPPAGGHHGTFTALEEQVLLFGGTAPRTDDPLPPQVFDPDRGTWTVLPDAPFGHGTRSPVAAPVPGGFVLLSEACDREEPAETQDSGVTVCVPGDIQMARFDLPDRRWRVLELPGALEGGGREPRELLVTPGLPSRGEVLVQWGRTTWRYEADGDRWTRVGDPTGAVCGTGAGFVEITGPNVPVGTKTAGDVGRRLEDDGSWTELAPDLGPIAKPGQSSIVCTPGSVLVLGREHQVGAPTTQARRLDVETGEWSDLEVPPEVLGSMSSGPVDDGAIVVTAAETGPTTWHYIDADQTWVPNDLPLLLAVVSVRHDGVFVGDTDLRQRHPIDGYSAVRLT